MLGSSGAYRRIRRPIQAIEPAGQWGSPAGGRQCDKGEMNGCVYPLLLRGRLPGVRCGRVELPELVEAVLSIHSSLGRVQSPPVRWLGQSRSRIGCRIRSRIYGLSV